MNHSVGNRAKQFRNSSPQRRADLGCRTFIPPELRRRLFPPESVHQCGLFYWCVLRTSASGPSSRRGVKAMRLCEPAQPNSPRVSARTGVTRMKRLTHDTGTGKKNWANYQRLKEGSGVGSLILK